MNEVSTPTTYRLRLSAFLSIVETTPRRANLSCTAGVLGFLSGLSHLSRWMSYKKTREHHALELHAHFSVRLGDFRGRCC